MLRHRNPGIVQHLTVNHSDKEWARPADILFNVETGETKHGIVSTRLIDGTWSKLKHDIPHGLAADTPERRAIKLEYIRAAQWRLMLAGQDRWKAFCQATCCWNHHQANTRSKLEPHLASGFASNEEETQGCESTHASGQQRRCVFTNRSTKTGVASML